MKLLQVSLFLFTINLFSQTWQTTSITSNINGQRFDDVFFLNETEGWAANGFYAAVYKTIDGGITWTEQLTEAMLDGSYYFRNIEFLNANIGFLGTLNGEFFKTADGGDTWELVTNIPTTPEAICGLHTIGTSTIYGCGAYFTPAYIIKSSDSGDTWEYIDMSAYANALVEIYFLNENVGYVSGNNATGGVILKTIDGGATWTELFNSNIIGEYVWKLQVLENSNTIIFGAIESVDPHPGKLIKSIDSGVSWTSYDAPETRIQAVGFISETHGWMGGHATGLHETTDGGETWTDLNIGSILNRIFIINSELAFASGTSIYKYTDEELSTDNIAETVRAHLNIELLNNPIKDNLEFTIHFNKSDNLLIELYDSSGRFIKTLSKEKITDSNLERTYNFSIKDLASGVYIIDFHNNNGRESKRFIKL